MGLWDDLSGWLRKSRDRAATEAAKAAARQAAEGAKASVEKAGEEFLGFAEKELESAKKAREGRPEYLPSREGADAIAARVEAAASGSRSAEDLLRASPAGSADAPSESAEARARAELDRLKAEARKKRTE